MTERLKVALHRHSKSESSDLPASPGARRLFTLLERILLERFELYRMPVFRVAEDPAASIETALEILLWADVCILSIPDHPNALDPLFLVREKLPRPVPFIYLPLGEFPRGAWCYSRYHTKFTSSDCLLFSSNADLNSCKQFVEVTPAKSVVIPFGIDTSLFANEIESREYWRREFNAKKDSKIVIYHGRIAPEKQVHGLIGVFSSIAKYFPKAELWLAGDPDADFDFETIRQRIPKGEYQQIRWLGNLPFESIPGLLVACDVGASLTLNPDENFGFGPVEAMASGLPVVATNWGGLKDTLSPKTAIRVPTVLTPIAPTFDITIARYGLLKLLSQSGIDHRERENAIEHVQEHFSLSIWGTRMESLINETVKHTPCSSAVKPQLTKLGKQIFDSYSSSNRCSFQIPPSGYLFERFALLRELLRPYASTNKNFAKSHCIAPASLFLSIKDNTVLSHDPYYQFKERELSTENIRILLKVISSGTRGLACNDVKSDSVRTLIAAGLAIFSPMCPQNEVPLKVN